MSRVKLFSAAVLFVLFLGSCIPTASVPRRASIAIDPRAQAYLTVPAENLSSSTFRVKGISMKTFQGKDYLTINGNYGYEFYGWNISKEQIASNIYDKMIPDFVRKISESFSPDYAVHGFDIVVNANIITDKQMYLNEQLYEKTGKRMGPFPAPRIVETVDYYVDKDAAAKYRNFEIDNANLRTQMMIIIDNQKRIP